MGGFPWQLLVIPLLLFGAWLVSQLFKAGEDSLDSARLNRGGGADRSSRRPPSDLDRFLSQARLKREAQEKQRQLPRPEARQEKPRPQRGPEPPPLGRAQAEQQAARMRDPGAGQKNAAASRRPSPAPPAVTGGRPVLLQLVPEPVALPQARPVPVRPAVPAETAAAPLPQLPSVAPTVTGRDRPPSPVLVQALALVRSPQSAAAALVLREIFDRPRCNRPLYPLP